MTKPLSRPTARAGRIEALALAREAQGPDLVIAVVGAVGSGTSSVARVLGRLLARAGAATVAIRASSVLERAAPLDWAAASAEPPIRRFVALQEIGSRLRHENDNAFVAAGMIAGIRCRPGSRPRPGHRHLRRAAPPGRGAAAALGLWRGLLAARRGLRRAHPARQADAEIRLRAGRPGRRPGSAGLHGAGREFRLEHGQKVADAFRYADFHCDSSASLPRADAPDPVLDAWPVTADLERFLALVRAAQPMLRPTEAEQAMYHAYAARLGSACLSRQVGAVLLGQDGQLLSTGCNEVPRAGGGLYGEGTDDPAEVERGRCHVYGGFCRNTDERNKLVDHVMELLEEQGVELGDAPRRALLARRLRRSRLGHLVEFSRSVHAEMDALISAARRGVSTVGTRLFVTTFPCHNCARHIVAAGVDEVQFIEPYLKSKALALHDDSITLPRPGWVAPSVARRLGQAGPQQVCFRPYVGAAPRLFRRAFLKDGEVKDGMFRPAAGDARGRLREPPAADRGLPRAGGAHRRAVRRGGLSCGWPALVGQSWFVSLGWQGVAAGIRFAVHKNGERRTMIHVLAMITAKPGMREQILEHFRAQHARRPRRAGLHRIRPGDRRRGHGQDPDAARRRQLRRHREVGKPRCAEGAWRGAAHGGLCGEDARTPSRVIHVLTPAA